MRFSKSQKRVRSGDHWLGSPEALPGHDEIMMHPTKSTFKAQRLSVLSIFRLLRQSKARSGSRTYRLLVPGMYDIASSVVPGISRRLSYSSLYFCLVEQSRGPRCGDHELQSSLYVCT